jgi:hypothetical protein
VAVQRLCVQFTETDFTQDLLQVASREEFKVHSLALRVAAEKKEYRTAIQLALFDEDCPEADALIESVEPKLFP